MIKCKANIISQNKEQLIRKIYKLYSYRTINKMIQTIEKNKKSQYFKKLIINLIKNLAKQTEFKTKGYHSSSNQTPLIKLSFKSNIINKKPKIINDKLLTLKKILPLFIKYLQNKINQRNSESFKRLKKYSSYSSFFKLYNNTIIKIIKNLENEFINKLKKNSEDYLTKKVISLNLFNIFKKYLIKKITMTLIEINRIYKIIYLMKMIRMHKKISKLRFIRKLIRKWSFYSFVHKMARRKMEKMYKNLHVSYLQMVDEVFG